MASKTLNSQSCPSSQKIAQTNLCPKMWHFVIRTINQAITADGTAHSDWSRAYNHWARGWVMHQWARGWEFLSIYPKNQRTHVMCWNFLGTSKYEFSKLCSNGCAWRVIIFYFRIYRTAYFKSRNWDAGTMFLKLMFKSMGSRKWHISEHGVAALLGIGHDDIPTQRNSNFSWFPLEFSYFSSIFMIFR